MRRLAILIFDAFESVALRRFARLVFIMAASIALGVGVGVGIEIAGWLR